MRKRGYLLPSVITTIPTRTLCVIIPDDPQYFANFWGHIGELGNWFAWEHGIAGDTRAKEAAELWRLLIHQSKLLNETGCITQGGDVDIRQLVGEPCILEYRNAGEDWQQFANLALCPPKIRTGFDGKIQYSPDDGATWEDIPPEPIPPRIGTPADTRCLAAANAVNVLAALHEEVVLRFAPGIPILAIAIGIGLALVSLLGLYILAANIALILGTALIYSSALTSASFSRAVKEELQCLLYENAIVTDGIVTFNFSDVYAAVITKQVFGNIWNVLNIYLDIIGEDGLNRAGATTAITTAECCAPPNNCYNYDFSTSPQGWQVQAYNTYWRSGFGWSSGLTEQFEGIWGYRMSITTEWLTARTVTSVTVNWGGPVSAVIVYFINPTGGTVYAWSANGGQGQGAGFANITIPIANVKKIIILRGAGSPGGQGSFIANFSVCFQP